MLSYLNNNYSAGCCSTQTHYSDSEPNSICSFSLMLLVSWRSSKYQFYSLLFDQTGDETIDLLHSMSISQLLHHTSGLYYCCTLCQYPNHYTTQAVYITAALYVNIPTITPHKRSILLLHSMSISQPLHHTSGLYYCCTLCQYPNYYTTQAVYITAALYVNIPTITPHKRSILLLHSMSISQLLHHTSGLYYNN